MLIGGPPKKAKKKKAYTLPRTHTTDVQSSGGNYGIPKANKYKKTKPYKQAIAKTYAEQPRAQRKAIRHNAEPSIRKVVLKQEHKIHAKKQKARRAASVRTSATSYDLLRAERYKVKHPEQFPKPKKHTTLKAPRLQPATIPVAQATAALNRSPIKKTAAKVFENAAREAVDIPANIVPTTAYIAGPAISKHNIKGLKESGKRLVNAEVSLPKALIEHPGKTLKEHPLSSALLVAPVGKLPIRGLRAVQRRAPAGSVLEKAVGAPPKTEITTLPGTRLKENRRTTTGYVRNIAKRTINKPSKHISNKEIATNVDETVARMEGMTRRESAKIAKKTYRAGRKELGMTKKEAGHAAAKAATATEKQIRKEQKQHMIDVMGLTEKPKMKGGHVLNAESLHKAKIYKNFKIADVIAKKATVGDVEFTPWPAKGGFAVLPKSAIKRWEQHTTSHEFGPAEALVRMYSTAWRRNVLAFHPTWYTGNVLEAALRSAIGGVGPASFYRGYKVAGSGGIRIPGTEKRIGAFQGELEKIDPTAAKNLAHTVYSGGHLAMQANLPREYALNISGHGPLANGLRWAQNLRKGYSKGGKETRRAAATRNIIDGYEALSDFTMGTLSGGVEGFFQKGMMGKALSKDPIMNEHMVKVTKAAIQDAARGLRETENQVKMGRIVDEMYGQYGKWSPSQRFWIANYTPFISWTMNALNFLYRTLPRDHPVLVAAAASVQPYVQEWLKSKGLSKFVKGAVPAFLQGAVPTQGGQFARYPTRYTPFAAAAQFPEDIGDLFLPQFSSAIEQLTLGLNWKGQQMKNPDGTPLDPLQRSVASALTLFEGAIPASQQMIGAEENYEKGARGSNIFKPKAPSESLPQLNPFKKVASPKKKNKGTSPKSLYDGLSGSGSSSLYP